MCATEAFPIRLQPMPDDPAPAVLTVRRQRLNRAFEAVERVRLPTHHHFKTLVVIVPADFALCHGDSPQKNPAITGYGLWLATIPVPPRTRLIANRIPDKRQK
jgi:hypothetical protein